MLLSTTRIKRYRNDVITEFCDSELKQIGIDSISVSLAEVYSLVRQLFLCCCCFFFVVVGIWSFFIPAIRYHALSVNNAGGILWRHFLALCHWLLQRKSAVLIDFFAGKEERKWQ